MIKLKLSQRCTFADPTVEEFGQDRHDSFFAEKAVAIDMD